jgi:hypothetical protein
VVGIISSCVGAIEPCATGCTLMGPVDVDPRLGIMDNSQVQSSFTALKGRAPRLKGEALIVPV